MKILITRVLVALSMVSVTAYAQNDLNPDWNPSSGLPSHRFDDAVPGMTETEKADAARALAKGRWDSFENNHPVAAAVIRAAAILGRAGLIIPPVVLDLNRDGKIQLIDKKSDASQYGMIGVDHGWVGPKDGVVVIDVDKNNKINRWDEIAPALLTDNIKDSDLEAIATLFDDNNDNQLDARDSMFPHFGVWQDKNQNSLPEKGEIQSFAERGIKSLQLKHDGRARRVGKNVVLGNSRFVWANGRTGKSWDVALWVETVDQKDLNFIKTRNAHSNRVEFHSLDSVGGYEDHKAFVSNFVQEDRANGVFKIAHMDADQRPDLVYIKTKNTRSTKVELHWMTAASNFKKHFAYVTALSTNPEHIQGDFELADMDADGQLDLVFLKTRNTGSIYVESHWLSGKSNYKVFGGHDMTKMAIKDVWKGSMQFANMDSDGKPDLVFIKTKNVASGKVEVHWLSARTTFRQFGGHHITRFTNNDGGKGAFQMVNMDFDGKPDLVFIKTRNTASNRIEVHWVSWHSWFLEFGGHYRTRFHRSESYNGILQMG